MLSSSEELCGEAREHRSSDGPTRALLCWVADTDVNDVAGLVDRSDADERREKASRLGAALAIIFGARAGLAAHTHADDGRGSARRELTVDCALEHVANAASRLDAYDTSTA